MSLWANRKVPKMGPKVRCVGNANEWEYGILRWWHVWVTFLRPFQPYKVRLIWNHFWLIAGILLNVCMRLCPSGPTGRCPKMGPKVRCVGNANEWEYGILRWWHFWVTFLRPFQPYKVRLIWNHFWLIAGIPAERGHASDCHFFITKMLKVLRNAWNSEIRLNLKQWLRIGGFIDYICAVLLP